MTTRHPTKSDQAALAAKPRKLATIDRRIDEPVPRLSEKQRAARARQLMPEDLELLVHGRATTAWITKRESGWDNGYEAGPWYRVCYCFETEDGRLRHDSCGGAFDGLHLGYGGGNEWTRFLAKCCDESGPSSFTVLHDDQESAPVAWLLSR